MSTCVLHCSYAMGIPDFVLDMQLWYSQQVKEGKAPGHPLGFGGEEEQLRLVNDTN